ncbi:MAG TPA: hypothetical protein VNY73_09880 [Bacteroidia bacterium]|nr:hypothetical protein [Bacteroidia bacterium]
MRPYLFLLMLLVSLSSCSYQKLEFEKASGKYNKVKTGKRFCVSLPEDHKTKFYWGVIHDYDKKVVSYMTSVFHGETVEFNFEALAPGKTEIVFSLNGYNETKETRSFLVEVE